MVGITTRAAKLLKEKLAQVSMEAGGLGMISVSPEAAETLKEKLVRSCLEAGIGFRMLVDEDERGEMAFSLTVDSEREGDQVLEIEGVRVFVDPGSTTLAADRELDYIDGPRGGFVPK